MAAAKVDAARVPCTWEAMKECMLVEDASKRRVDSCKGDMAMMDMGKAMM
jgi:hypothetical protein